MSKLIDLHGKMFGSLVVLYRDNTSAQYVKWVCRCACGTIKSIHGAALRQELTRSCGCFNRVALSKRTLKDIIGQRFGRLVVRVRISGNSQGARWLCQCDCGGTITALGKTLRQGFAVSCGCKHQENIFDDLSGQQFSRLVVLERAKKPNIKSRTMYWLCQCACGNTCVISANSLRHGKTQSCGCLARLRHPRGDQHPQWQGGKTPESARLRHSPAYATWRHTVFERDDYTCALCYARGGKLHAHHIRRFAHYPALVFEVSNGITLCTVCHASIYGKEEEFEHQFLAMAGSNSSLPRGCILVFP